MKTPVYAVDGVTLVGHLVDGTFEPTGQATSPVPTGDELENLLDDCCLTIERMFGSYKPSRLHPDLRLGDGQHSLVLTNGRNRLDIRKGHDGVRSWITQGSLRSVDELTPVLNAFWDDMKRKLRQRNRFVSPDWMLDNDALIILSSRFGIPAPKTFEELAAKRQADDAERERQKQEREVRERAARQAYESSPAYAEEKRKNELRQAKSDRVRDILMALVPAVVFRDPENPTHDEKVEAGVAGDDRKYLRPFVEVVVNQTSLAPSTIVAVWQDIECVYTEAFEALEGTKHERQMKPVEEVAVKKLLKIAREVAKFGPTELPELQPGEQRLTFNHDDLLAFIKSGEFDRLLDTNDLVTRLAFDGLFAVDVIAKTQEQSAPAARCRL